MAKVKIGSKLPDGESNGLVAVHGQLVDNPGDLVVCIVMLDTEKIETILDTGEVIPTARVRHIEAVLDRADARELGRLLMRERERRLGATVLPLDLEQSLRSAVGMFDPGTGEIGDG